MKKLTNALHDIVEFCGGMLVILIGVIFGLLIIALVICTLVLILDWLFPGVNMGTYYIFNLFGF